MEDRDNYSSLQEFSEEQTRGGNRRVVQNGDGNVLLLLRHSYGNKYMQTENVEL